MDTRQPIHSDHAKTLDSAGLRTQFLVDSVFVRGQLTLTYSQIDRIIVGGAMPLGEELGFTADLAKRFAVGTFLERRELGVINVGGAGIGGRRRGDARDRARRRALRRHGRARRPVPQRRRREPGQVLSQQRPAHRATRRAGSRRPRPPDDARRCGDRNVRTIYKLLVPGVVERCQLTMGMTVLEPGSVWNTSRRTPTSAAWRSISTSGIPADAAVFHLCGGRTRPATSSCATSRP